MDIEYSFAMRITDSRQKIRPGMDGKAKKVSFFLARVGRVYKAAAARDYSPWVVYNFPTVYLWIRSAKQWRSCVLAAVL